MNRYNVVSKIWIATLIVALIGLESQHRDDVARIKTLEHYKETDLGHVLIGGAKFHFDDDPDAVYYPVLKRYTP